MPWTTPTLQQVRAMTRDNTAAILATATIPKQQILASLNRQATIGNSVLRVMCDAMSGLAHLTLKYLDWLSLQFLPDTAETEWLDRHGNIWLVNADGTVGRKQATLATGTATVTGVVGSTVPAGTTLTSAAEIGYEVLAQTTVGSTPTPMPIRALDPGSAGNLATGDTLPFDIAPNGVDKDAVVVSLYGGTDMETDDELRARILFRIREPPMGGDKTDYEQWALAVPGVTRAWASPLEQGMGSVTTRFMMDDLRADNNGIPLAEDVVAVEAYIDSKRPVAVKDIYVVAPIPFPINLAINSLVTDNGSTRAAIEESLRQMFFDRAVPGGTVYRSWVDSAISDAVGEDHHELTYTTTTAPSPGHLPILGSVIYAGG
jgi:uncharacterized phage protein gp47/JayE